MRLIVTITVILVLWTNMSCLSQQMIFPKAQKSKITNTGSALHEDKLVATFNPNDGLENNWAVNLKNFSSFHHVSSVKPEVLANMKKVANQKKGTALPQLGNERIQEVSPVLDKNFRGNERNSSVPLDNSMAISTNGFIVSAINTNVVFSNPAGDITFKQDLSDFFSLLGLGTRMYDPRVIFDIEQNKFIFMCLNGSDPASTNLCIAFSKTEDPNGEWNYYKIDGNPLGDNNWFDYPNIAVSKNDLYIAGLMRDNPGDWVYSVLYQVDKLDGFSGNTLTWKHYSDLKDADGTPSFNLVPTPSGWKQLLDPGMYFVSNIATGGDKYNLYYTTADVNHNPELISLQMQGLATELAPDGKQKGTDQVLNTFDSRIWSAMYLNGIIHIGGHVMSPYGTSALLYGRINVSDVSIDATTYAKPELDYGFPSFSAFGNSESDTKILVNHLISGTNIYPSQEVFVCSGSGSEFMWSDSVLVKEGVDYIDALADEFERWGDYTTSCRRFNGDRIENWITGCFGEQRRYGTWLGQLLSADQIDVKNYVDFSANKTYAQANASVTFHDLTSPNATVWEWTFAGGNPATSNLQNPIVKYASNGVYDVTLTVTTLKGTETLSKPAFIHIVDPVIAPIANFTMDRDTIFTNDTVTYFDASLNNPITYSWTFSSGTPNKSEEKMEKVTYKNSGTFGVIHVVKNLAGENTKIVAKAITVLKRTQPIADFSVDKNVIAAGETVSFFDLSKNGPTKWEWTFEGGNPSTSTEKNPIVQYAINGTYGVTLKSSNDAGEATITKPAFINVGMTSVNNQKELIQEVKLYPNPSNGERVYLRFVLTEKKMLNFYIFDKNGRMVKQLVKNTKVKQGENELSFNAENLANGEYLLLVTDQNGIEKQAVHFIIVD